MAEGGTRRLTAAISSTARDLPDHRRQVMDACQRQGMFPKMMEHLPATDADAISASIALVEEADIYLGLFAFRYGYVPAGHDISLTEMEYNRAVERKIPRLIFLMHEDHPVRPMDVETGLGAERLKALKDRLKADQVVNFFKSPADLRADVINSLSHIRVKEEKQDVAPFHSVGDIPSPPEPYIPHPYTLLQSKGVIGRQNELKLLADWLANPAADVYQARILSIVAIGGMGKSALAWKWFNEITSQEMKAVNGQEWGRMWWSFYESDASFENFLVRALAYVTGRSRHEVQKMSSPEREEQLLGVLDCDPHILVLDGLERVLLAYAHRDAALLSDDDLDEQTAHQVTGAIEFPPGVKESPVGQHRLRKTADVRVGSFLRRLARVRASRILVSTRLFPADLQNRVTNEPIPGCFARFLRGLNDDDAFNLWRSFEVNGSRETVLSVFRTFENHPLLIQTLARKIAHYRRAPGDFDRWRKDHPSFDPFSLPLVQVKSHVLEFALRDLDQSTLHLLKTIAAVRTPANYDTLRALSVGSGRPFAGEEALDSALSDLEDRGLIGWDRRKNRYDLHPIVRGVAWSLLTDEAKRQIYQDLIVHLRTMPGISQGVSREQFFSSSEGVSIFSELYHALIGLGQYDQAFDLYTDWSHTISLLYISARLLSAELLEMLFPDGFDQLPRLPDLRGQYLALNNLAVSYVRLGEPRRAVPLLLRGKQVWERRWQNEDEVARYHRGIGDLVRLHLNLGNVLLDLGSLWSSEVAARKALLFERDQSAYHRETAWSEPICLLTLGRALAARGRATDARAIMQRSFQLQTARFRGDSRIEQDAIIAGLCELALWTRDAAEARSQAERAWKLIEDRRGPTDIGDNVRAVRLMGFNALLHGDAAAAGAWLLKAQRYARAANLIHEEIAILLGLVEAGILQGDSKSAREALDDVWEPVERGPFPLFHADALNLLAQIEHDGSQTDPKRHDAAITAATKAYHLAWCDGPPFAYHWGLEAAKRHLGELGAPEPTDLPPFDESKYEPMPEVEIILRDESHP
jgi:tetratricopeptide (TPR) repeat protein